MARGGARQGAGRPQGIHTQWSKESQDRFRAKIQTEQIIQRLDQYVAGAVKMEPAAVTAALGLLKKVMPDMAYVEHAGEIAASKVIRAPAMAATPTEWAEQHFPEQHTEH